MRGKVTVTGANIVFFMFTAFFMLFQVVLAVLTAVFGEDFLPDNMYTILLINQYVIILIPVAVYTIIRKLDIREVFRLKPLQPLAGVLIILLAMPAQFVGNMLNTTVVYFLQFLGDIPATPMPAPKDYAGLAVSIAVIAVSPAIFEELLHRGIMLSAYERRGSFRALLFTAFFFAIFHFDPTNFLGVIFLGFIIGYYVLRTNSIFAGMLAHFLNNLIALLIQFFTDKGASPERFLTVSQEQLYSVILLGIAGLILVIFLLLALKHVTASRYQEKPPISSIGRDIASIFSHWPIIVIMLLYLLFGAIFILAVIADKV